MMPYKTKTLTSGNLNECSIIATFVYRLCNQLLSDSTLCELLVHNGSLTTCAEAHH